MKTKGKKAITFFYNDDGTLSRTEQGELFQKAPALLRADVFNEIMQAVKVLNMASLEDLHRELKKQKELPFPVAVNPASFKLDEE